MSDDTPAGDEIDALKVYVWGMTAVAVVGAGVVWWLTGQVDDLRKTVASARGSVSEVARSKAEILAMLNAYKKNKEDEARDQPLTWFQSVWKSVGISDSSVQLDAWKNPPDVGDDGTYKEEKIGLKFSNKNPLRRDQIGQFVHRVEQNSSRLRVISLRIRRTGREDSLANDEWAGECEVGYRYPFARD